MAEIETAIGFRDVRLLGQPLLLIPPWISISAERIEKIDQTIWQVALPAMVQRAGGGADQRIGGRLLQIEADSELLESDRSPDCGWLCVPWLRLRDRFVPVADAGFPLGGRHRSDRGD